MLLLFKGLKLRKGKKYFIYGVLKVFHLPTFFLAQTGTAQSHDDIAWSSSDSEQSDDGSRDQRRSTVLVQQRHRRPTAPIQTCGKVLCKPGTDEGMS